MRVAIVVATLFCIACRADRRADEAAGDAALMDRMLAETGRDSALVVPLVVTQPSVIVFWLAAGDTLHPDDASAAVDDLNYFTEQISADLERWGIALLPTNADTVYIGLPNNKRRAVLLAGLEYPFGYVIAEPGGVERILPGVYSAEELIEEVKVYFDLEDDTTAGPPKVITD